MFPRRQASAKLTRVTVDGEDYRAWILKVVGKRKIAREVPVPDDVVELLRNHRQDMREPLPGEDPQTWPLIGVLYRRVTSNAQPETPPKPDMAPPSPALSSSGIYALLTTLFSRVALSAPPEVDPDHLSKASTHWLRHTFGRQGAEALVPIEVLQQSLGHKDLSTTTIYLSTERTRMVKELRKMRRPRDGASRW